VSGSLRGGNQCQQARGAPSPDISASASVAASKPAAKKKEKKNTVETLNIDHDTMHEDIESAVEAAQDKSPASSSSKNKKRELESDDAESDNAQKKAKRAVPLATGDRNTTATEIASGPAGADFPEGWTVKTYRRAGGETIGKTDRFWFSRKYP
jgi:methylthioribose-1-phosphate isomerase